MDRQILVNALVTPDGTYLESRHRHDFKSHVDSITGEVYMIDGGLDYFRCSQNTVEPTYIRIFADDPHDLVRNNLKWGTYGKDGKQPYKEVLIKDLTTEHIQAILSLGYLKEGLTKAFQEELIWRSGG